MGPLLLLLTTLIWGTAFLAQKSGADYLGPFSLTVFRNILGGVFLLGCVAVRRFCRGCGSPQGADPSSRGCGSGRSVLAGVACGVPLFAAMIAQQVGIEDTTPGVSAFLTTNYVLFVPLLASALKRRLPCGGDLAGAALAVFGTYLICVNGASVGLGRGEAWTILCALLFSVQMIVVDRFASRCDVLVMSATQLFTGAVLGVPCLFLSGEVARLSLSALASGWWAVFYCGVFSSGIAYTLQNFGQARTPPALAAIICSLESVFGALAGWIVRGDVLSSGQLAGCGAVFAAVILSQLFAFCRMRRPCGCRTNRP